MLTQAIVRTIPSRRFTLRLGRFGHRTLHRPFRRWRRLGHLHNRLLYSWRWSQSASHPNQEPDLHYLLRSRRDLRCHHVDRFLCETQLGRGRCAVLRRKLLYGLCAVLGGIDGRHV